MAMKTLEFDEKTHDNDSKFKASWMGHGGTWKMSASG